MVVGYSYWAEDQVFLQASLADRVPAGRTGDPCGAVGRVTLKATREGLGFKPMSMPDSPGRYAFLLQPVSRSAVVFLLPFEVR